MKRKTFIYYRIGLVYLIGISVFSGYSGEEKKRERLTLQDFIWHEIDTSKAEKRIATLKGKHAVLQGSNIELSQFEGELYTEKGKRVRLWSDNFFYNKVKQIGYSDKEVLIRRENLFIRGIGFDCDLKRQRLMVRDRVKIKLFYSSQVKPADKN